MNYFSNSKDISGMIPFKQSLVYLCGVTGISFLGFQFSPLVVHLVFGYTDLTAIQLELIIRLTKSLFLFFIPISSMHILATFIASKQFSRTLAITGVLIISSCLFCLRYFQPYFDLDGVVYSYGISSVIACIFMLLSLNRRVNF